MSRARILTHWPVSRQCFYAPQPVQAFCWTRPKSHDCLSKPDVQLAPFAFRSKKRLLSWRYSHGCLVDASDGLDMFVVVTVVELQPCSPINQVIIRPSSTYLSPQLSTQPLTLCNCKGDAESGWYGRRRFFFCMGHGKGKQVRRSRWAKNLGR